MDWQSGGIALRENRVDDVRVLGHRGLRQFLDSRGQLVSIGEGCGIEGLKINAKVEKSILPATWKSARPRDTETLGNSVEKESLPSPIPYLKLGTISPTLPRLVVSK